MSRDEGSPFIDLEPPPGGVSRFRRRLEELREPAPRGRRHLAIAGVAVSMLALLVLIAVTRQGPEARVARVYEAAEFDRLLGRPMDPAGFSISVDGKSTSISEIASTHENVRIYMIDVDR